MATSAEGCGLDARSRAARRLMHVCIGAGPIHLEPIAHGHVGSLSPPLRTAFDCGEDLPADWATLIERIDAAPEQRR